MPSPPKLRPGGTTAILLVAWIAYESSEKGKIGGNAEQEASYRHLQRVFRVTSLNSVGKILTTLARPTASRLGAWIAVTRRSSGVNGHHYGLGPAAAGNAEDWIKLGCHLFGPEGGVLAPYMSRPILLGPKYGLGHRGCLTLAYIAASGPLTQPAVVAALRPFMDAKTIRDKIKRCVASGFVIETDGLLRSPDNLDELIRNDEFLFGAEARASEIDAAIGKEQYAYQIGLLGGPTLVRIYSLLKNSPCFYCRTAPPPEGEEVEHFPPLHWGGSDEYSLLLPICRRCNAPHGGIIRRTTPIAAPPPFSGRIVFPGSSHEAALWFLKVMMLRAAIYADELNRRCVDDARDTALRLFPIWMALKNGVEVINSHTGEISMARADNDVDLIELMSSEFGGLPGLLDNGPRMGKPRAPKRRGERRH